MSKGKLYELNEAREAAESIRCDLMRFCKAIQIAGSIRREKSYVHDIDLVVWPRCEVVGTGQPDLFGKCDGSEPLPVGLMNYLRDGWREIELNPYYYPRKIVLPGQSEDICEYDIDTIQVELYLCEPDGNNYEALIQMRTGSEGFNISLAARAKRMGLQYRAGYGIFDKDGNRWDDGTERGIFDALCIPWIDPQERTGDYRVVLTAYAAKNLKIGAGVE